MKSKNRTVKWILSGMVFLLIFTLTLTVVAQTTFTLPIGWMGDLTSDGTFLYMTTMAGSRPIIKIDPTTGEIIDIIEQNPFSTSGPRGAAFDGADHLFLTSMSPTVVELDMNGTFVSSFTVLDPIPGNPGDFRTGAIAFDGENLYIGDTDGSTVVVTDRSGNVIRHFDSGSRPAGMEFDETTGNLWFVDCFATDKVFEMTTNGDIVRDCDITYSPEVYSLGGIEIVGSKFYISELLNPYNPEEGTNIHVLERSSLICSPPIIVQVAIDIKPQSATNSINPRSKGVIPVAILTTDDFDAATVDPTTVRFGRTGSEAAKERSTLNDVDGDGDIDLLFHFRTQDTGFLCGDTSASLTGETVDGQPINGSDSIRTVGCKKSH